MNPSISVDRDGSGSSYPFTVPWMSLCNSEHQEVSVHSKTPFSNIGNGIFSKEPNCELQTLSRQRLSLLTVLLVPISVVLLRTVLRTSVLRGSDIWASVALMIRMSVS